MKTMRVPVLVTCWCATLSFGVQAQTASPYVPVDEWIMPFVEHLIRTGVLGDPAPLSRPLRQVWVQGALAAVDTASLPDAVRETIRLIRGALDDGAAPRRVRVQGFGGGEVATYSRRNPLRQRGNEVIAPSVGAAVDGVVGPFAFSSRGFFDGRLKEDVDYSGQKDRWAAGRITDAYVSLQGRYGEITFGAVDRNWGPTGVPGTLVSWEPYSYDHLFVRVGTSRARMETLITELDPLQDVSGLPIRRFWAASRFVVIPTRSLTVSLGQGTLWSGVGRGWELRWLNPFKGASLTRDDEPDGAPVNSMYTLDARFALPKGIMVQGDLLIDDLSSVLSSSTAPDRVAATVVVDAPLSGTTSARMLYTVVSSLTYRSSQGLDQSVMRRGVGLGRNFADYTAATVELSVLPRPGFLVRPQVTLLEQGEGDFRSPFPSLPAPNHPFLFEGVVERTWRFATSLDVQPVRRLSVRADIGLHLIQSLGHVVGENDAEFVGGIRATYRVRWAGALP